MFALGIRDLTNSCQSETNMWYLDDGCLAGDPHQVLQDLQTISAASDSLGLEINPGKCELYFTNPDMESYHQVLSSFQSEAPGIKVLNNESLTLLGAPIMAEAVEGVLKQKLEDLKLMVERLTLIDPHDALFLLRQCFAIPKLMYFIRSAPCFGHNTLEEYDHQLKIGLEEILNIRLEENAWVQATLPVRKGGLGIRLASDLALPAFLSSAWGASSGAESLLTEEVLEAGYKQLDRAEEKWDECFRLDDPLPFPECALQPENKSVQAQWDAPLYEKRFNDLLDSHTLPSERARLRAVASEHSSDWLNALPLPKMGLKLDRAEIRIACGLRLGSAVVDPHKCHNCGETVTKLGRHGLSCKKAKGTQSRHWHGNELIKRALISAQIPARREPQNLNRSNNLRPDGRTMVPWSEGKILVWDYTVSDTLAQSHVGPNSS